MMIVNINAFLISFSNMLDDFGRDAGGYHICGYIFGNNGSGSNDGIITNRDTGGYSDIGTDPHPVADMYRFMGEILTLGRVMIMIQSSQDYTMAYEATVADIDSTLILKVTT